MSLLLLLKPNGTGVVITPPATTAAPTVIATKRIPPPQVFHFEAETARIILRALQPSLILIPELDRATVSLRGKQPSLEAQFSSLAKKKQDPVSYRAVKDEREDEEFERLVETAYLLTR